MHPLLLAAAAFFAAMSLSVHARGVDDVKATSAAASNAAAVAGAAAVSGAASVVNVVNKPELTSNPSLVSNPHLESNPVVTANPVVNVNPSNVSSPNQTSVNNVSPSNALTIDNPDRIRIANTPNASVFLAPPSATCIVTASGTLSLPGFGAGLGGGRLDEGCVARENARLLNLLGEREAAILVLCESDPKVAKHLKACAAIAKEQAAR